MFLNSINIYDKSLSLELISFLFSLTIYAIMTKTGWYLLILFVCLNIKNVFNPAINKCNKHMYSMGSHLQLIFFFVMSSISAA